MLFDCYHDDECDSIEVLHATALILLETMNALASASKGGNVVTIP
jgi:hypothetical protein